MSLTERDAAQDRTGDSKQTLIDCEGKQIRLPTAIFVIAAKCSMR